MKKLIYLSLAALILLPTLSLAQVQFTQEVTDPRGVTKDATGKILAPSPKFNILSRGARGPEVEDLQRILKSNPTIYPEGLTTGYYGPLTERAVKRLQERFKLPQTGMIDQATSKIILPWPTEVTITVVSPNGGEVWEKNSVHEIKWMIATAYPVGTEPKEPLYGPEIESLFFWPQGRIDLIKNNGTFVRHIATVNLAQGKYNWKIDPSIPNGDDYKIRIGVGPVVVCSGQEYCPLKWFPNLYPRFTFGDESDGPFTITMGSPPPDQIKKAISILHEIMRQLDRLLAILEAMA